MAGKSLATVFVAVEDRKIIGYEVACPSCGWEFEGNPFYNNFDAWDVAEAHVCGKASDARQRS